MGILIISVLWQSGLRCNLEWMKMMQKKKLIRVSHFELQNLVKFKTVVCIFIKLGRYVHQDLTMNPVDFSGERLRS